MEREKSMERGRLYVVSAPSGAGKTSLVKALMEREPRLRFSVSYTTRKPRANEIDGRDYHFIAADRFQEMVDRGEFLGLITRIDLVNWLRRRL